MKRKCFFASLFVLLLCGTLAAQEEKVWGSVDDKFLPSLDGNVLDMELLPDGKAIIVGAFNNGGHTEETALASGSIMRLMPNGDPDLTFNQGGSGFNDIAMDIALTADGKYMVCGVFTSYNGKEVGQLVRLNADGSLDETFQTGHLFALEGFNEAYGCEVQRVMVHPSGDVYVAGAFNKVNGSFAPLVARFSADGKHDATYAPVETINQNSAPNVLGSYMDPDGSFFLLGYFTKYNGETGRDRIVHFKADGSFDADFVKHKFTDAYSYGAGLKSMTAFGEDKYLVAGDFAQVDKQPFFLTCVMNKDGSLDETYTPYDFFSQNEDADWSCYSAVAYKDHVFIVGGDAVDPRTSFLYALTADGSTLATDFDFGSAPNKVPTFLKVDPTGGWLYVSGLFTQIAGISVPYFTRMAIQSNVAISEIEQQAEINCVQVDNFLRITSPVALSDVVLYDLAGALVARGVVEGSNASVSLPTAGNYVVLVTTAAGTKKAQKVVVTAWN